MTRKEIEAHDGKLWFNQNQNPAGYVTGFYPISGSFQGFMGPHVIIRDVLRYYVEPGRLYRSKTALAKAFKRNMRDKLRNLADGKRKYAKSVNNEIATIKRDMAVADYHLKREGK